MVTSALNKILKGEKMNRRVYVGYDPREDIAYQVCKYSIESRSPGVEVIPLKQKELRNYELYWRAPDPMASTEFTFTRFLVPELNKFEGWALFCDSDIVFTEDVNNLFDQADDQYAVMCAKHDYTPEEGIKMDGQVQTQYPRKNWSSVVLFNCSHPSNASLTKERVSDESKTGAYFHRFQWLKDQEIGGFSHEWNWLVNWYEYEKDGIPRGIHWTEGGPWFDDPQYRWCEFGDIWKSELMKMMYSR